MDSYFSFLRSLYFFKNLSDDDLLFLNAHFHKETIEENQVLFFENSVADKFYIVLSGSIGIWKAWGSPDAVRLAVEGRGHVFGEMALVDDLPRSATVVTQETSEFLFLYHKEFEVIMKERTSVTLAIIRSLTSMVRNSNDVFVKSLTQQNNALAQAYRDLKDAQDRLIRNERLSNLGKFASYVLHDLRNPLAAIRGYAEIITLEEEGGSNIADYASKIITEADYLNRFANELLDYSRGSIRLNYRETNVHAMFKKLSVYVEEPMKRRSIRFDTNVEIQQTITIDEDRIIRALMNMCDNGRKACAAGGLVAVKAWECDGYVFFSVTDNGEGMTNEVMQKMFDPFYSSSKQGGTGLGMLIVKNVVEAHDGTIQVESTLGLGTTITFSLPLQPHSVHNFLK